MAVLPVVLATDTIEECAFEIRFAAGNPSASDLLPGLVFQKLAHRFGKVTTLPAGQIPSMVRGVNPQFHYAATHALEGHGIRLGFGPRSALVSFAKPYPGWDKVQPAILECMTAVINTKMMGAPERLGLKYVNLLRHGQDEHDLSQTSLMLQLGQFPLRKGSSAYVRGEVDRNGCIGIVEVISGAQVQPAPGLPGAKGVVVTVDVVLSNWGTNILTDMPQVLETLHTTEKEIFFGMLAPATLRALGPTYVATN